MNKNMEKIVRILFGERKEIWLNTALIIFRVVIGVFMLTHGMQKLSNFDSLQSSFPDPIGLGSSFSLVLIILAEVGCSLLIILGAFTRLATIPLIFGMIVAAFIVHSGGGFSGRELPLFYMAMYIVLLITGPGAYSLDSLFLRGIRRI